MEWLSNSIIYSVEGFERGTDFLGKNIMRTLLIVVLVLFVVVYFKEVSNFVTGNASTVGQTVSKWLVDHTPKK